MSHDELLSALLAAIALFALWAPIFASRADRAGRQAKALADRRWEVMVRPRPCVTFEAADTFMDETSEAVSPYDRSHRRQLREPFARAGDLLRQAPMGSRLLVVTGVLAQHPFEMPAAEDRPRRRRGPVPDFELPDADGKPVRLHD
jgi:hypothetical protein